MFDVPIFGEMGSGSVIQHRKNYPIHRITLAEIRINAVAELTVAAGGRVLTLALYLAMKEIHDDLFSPRPRRMAVMNAADMYTTND